MIRRLRAAMLAAVTLFSIALAPHARAADTVAVTDVLGREVQVPKQLRRLLLGFYFEDFQAIVGPGAFDRVVAISRPVWEGWRPTQWQAYLAAAPRIAELADIGDFETGTFNIEAAIAAKPDLAILAAWQFRALGAAEAKLAAAGIPVAVVDYNAQTVDLHLASTRLIGRLTGSEVRAERLAGEYQAAVADVLARVAKAKGPRPKVYVELGNKGAGEYGNSYAGTMWGRVVEMAGGENIAAGKIENWGPLNPEHVLASRPDAIFIAGSGWLKRPQAVLMGYGIEPSATREKMRPFLGRAGWAGLPAAKAGAVHALYHGGARTLYDYTFLQYIAKQLHPDLFADVDPVENHRRFYATYLPIRAEGSFMVKLD